MAAKIPERGDLSEREKKKLLEETLIKAGGPRSQTEAKLSVGTHKGGTICGGGLNSPKSISGLKKKKEEVG